jgi:hypothetical protein
MKIRKKLVNKVRNEELSVLFDKKANIKQLNLLEIEFGNSGHKWKQQ